MISVIADYGTFVILEDPQGRFIFYEDGQTEELERY